MEIVKDIEQFVNKFRKENGLIIIDDTNIKIYKTKHIDTHHDDNITIIKPNFIKKKLIIKKKNVS